MTDVETNWTRLFSGFALVALIGASTGCTVQPRGGGGGDDECDDSSDCADDEVCDDGECKEIDPGPSGAGAQGVGGSATQGVSTSQSASGPGSGGTGAVGAGGSSTCDLGSDGCIGCSELLTFPECTQDDLCGASFSIASALLGCACSFCDVDCGSSVCASSATPPSAACSSCVQTECPEEVATCFNDVSS